MPEGTDEDVEGRENEVYVIWDFNDDPWKTKMKWEYSEFFKAYTATIPVIDGSQFKFIVEEKLMTSSMHPTHYCLDSKTENNIVTTYHYIFDSDSKTANHKKSPLVSSLSLSNPAFNESILGMHK